MNDVNLCLANFLCKRSPELDMEFRPATNDFHEDIASPHDFLAAVHVVHDTPACSRGEQAFSGIRRLPHPGFFELRSIRLLIVLRAHIVLSANEQRST